MGKGDRKTAKGKRSIASYGNSRSHATTKATGAATAPVAKKTISTGTSARTVSKAPAKKAVAKKAAG